MHTKRYSVFISSTFEDLKTERQAVQDVVISAGDFPVQMESFPAADVDQFEFIKALIDKCDYYILIVAGRYGTPVDDGMSYTEKEYHYAVSRGIPVLVMLHGDRSSIPASKSEATDEGKRRLASFIKAVEANRLRKTWVTPDALKLAVREALDNAKATKPAVGWVRGDAVASSDLLEELNNTRKENAKLRETIGNLEVEISLPPIPAAGDRITIDLLPHTAKNRFGGKSGTAATVSATWISVFPLLFSNLKWGTYDGIGEDFYYIDHEESCIELGSAIASLAGSLDASRAYKISKVTLNRLISYFTEVGLINTNGADQPFNAAAQRVARRHIIAGDDAHSFEVIAGRISTDDEIPF